MGFTRLEINGAGATGRQPYEYGDLVGAINGEIYNHQNLAAAHGLRVGACDTHVVLPLVERIGARAIVELDGFYAGVVLRRSMGELLCLRDHMGKKPLFVGRSRGEIFVVSELKVFDDVDWFEQLPLGLSSVELRTGEVRLLASHTAAAVRGNLAAVVGEAVRKRLPSQTQRFAVFLSGGLDSSIVAAVVAAERADATYFTLGDADGPDRRAVEALARSLGLQDVIAVPLPTKERMPELVSCVVQSTESFNPSIVSNGIATHLLAAAAHARGIKIALTGDGADELFGGYHQFIQDDPWQEVRACLVDNMRATELRRLDLACMANAVEARCPFLDRAVRAHADSMGFDELYGCETNKVALRRAFEGILPHEVLHRRKTSFDVGSGVRSQVVSYLRRNGRSERDELRDVWRKHFTFDAGSPYFHAYPTFDAAIDVRGATHR
jgi:asparagine synthase (glutamine-hydrolysing)